MIFYTPKIPSAFYGDVPLFGDDADKNVVAAETAKLAADFEADCVWNVQTIILADESVSMWIKTQVTNFLGRGGDSTLTPKAFRLLFDYIQSGITQRRFFYGVNYIFICSEFNCVLITCYFSNFINSNTFSILFNL